MKLKMPSLYQIITRARAHGWEFVMHNKGAFADLGNGEKIFYNYRCEHTDPLIAAYNVCVDIAKHI